MRENGGGGCDGSPPVVVDEGKRSRYASRPEKSIVGWPNFPFLSETKGERERSFLHTHTQVFELSKKGGEGVFLAWQLGLSYTVS